MSFEPNEMMMDLFRSEVESHSEALISSVLALEQNPTAAATLERMMRAAHSIKGAARIVRVNAAVDVSHVMEDCFVAAQKGNLSFTPEDFDVILRGVDLLVEISAATKDPETSWAPIESSVQGMVSELRALLQSRPVAPDLDVIATAPQPSNFAGVTEAGATSTPPRLSGTPVVIVLPEFLDARAAELARRELLLALESGSREIQLNLAATHDLDALGLAFLAAARQHVAATSRTTLRFQPVSAELQTVLHVTGLDAVATGTAAQ